MTLLGVGGYLLAIGFTVAAARSLREHAAPEPSDEAPQLQAARDVTGRLPQQRTHGEDA